MAIVWRRKGALAASVLAMTAIGAVYLWKAQAIYQVEARLLIERQEQLPGAATAAGRETEQDKNFLATQAEILRSPAVVTRAVKQFRLRAPSDLPVDPVAAITASLDVSPVLGTNVLRISYRSPDAAEAARTVESLVGTYQQYALERERAAHSDAVRLLTQTEEELRGELESLEQAYRDGRQEQPVVTTLGPVEAVAADGVSLISLTSRAVGEGHAASDVKPLPEVPEADPSGRWNAAAIQEELARAEVRYMELSRSYGPRHPNVQAVQQQVDIWKRLLRERLDAEPIQRVKAAREAVLAQLQESARAEQALAAGRSELAIGMLQVPALDPVPVWPPRAVLLGACGTVGLMGGLGLIWLMERAAPTARRPQPVSTG
jgi:uncharacterized protein involved in exopolysaccharide biosynthesis